MRLRTLLIALACLPLLGGCGFTPLYATDDAAAGAPGLRQVRIEAMAASPELQPILTREFDRRTAIDETQAPYTITLNVREGARRLAVQIDDSVTRYNYRLNARYTLTRVADGKTFSDRVESYASFNVVASQYSTLYAEDAAREKAARTLVEDIEQSLLMRLAEEAEAEELSRAAAR